MIVRREIETDVADVRRIHVEAFRREPDAEPIEATLLDELRLDPGWLPQFSMVAVVDEVLIGHAVCTRGSVDSTPALGLGPIAVRPDTQRRGVGRALMHTMIGAADASGEPLIALLGSPEYYGHFGFVPSAAVGVTPPDDAWNEFFQVRLLHAHVPGLAGRFHYAEPFQRL